MNKCIAFASLFVILLQNITAANVGLLIMATGKYISFVEPLIQSAEKHFCINHLVTYFVFTDGSLPESDRVVEIYQKKLGWPFDTLMRYRAYYENKDFFANQDYLFACDADMLFVGAVGDEILGERVATQHPRYMKWRGPYEVNPQSTAFVFDFEGEHYFAGGFYGGSTKEMLHILQTNINHIDDDLSRGIVAVWHDESHWNRYCIDNKPTIILSPSYCYPESWALPFPKKILALDKDHKKIRLP